jgi:phospholipid transport system substrate-binding protein
MKILSLLPLLWAAMFAPLAPAADETPAQSLVRETSTDVLSRLRTDSAAIEANPALLDSIAQEVVFPHFDFERMSQRVLGVHWRNASDDQRKRFTAEFTTLLLRTYSTAIYQYRESEVRYMPARELSEKIQRIRTEVDRRDGRAPLQIDYDIFERPDGWKVLDVAINGISLVVSYRAGFSSDIAKMGMDGLISQMSEHNAQHPTLGKQG